MHALVWRSELVAVQLSVGRSHHNVVLSQTSSIERHSRSSRDLSTNGHQTLSMVRFPRGERAVGAVVVVVAGVGAV